MSVIVTDEEVEARSLTGPSTDSDEGERPLGRRFPVHKAQTWSREPGSLGDGWQGPDSLPPAHMASTVPLLPHFGVLRTNRKDQKLVLMQSRENFL